MKIAIIHLSDFHVHDNDHFLTPKINGLLSALNLLGKIDDYSIIFTGDLANSGQVNEYKQARFLLGKLVKGVKQKNGNKYVNMFVIPGNHDLYLPSSPRDREYIQEHYEKGTVETLLDNERHYLENFYNYSNTNGRIPYDFVLSRKFCTFGDYKIQFNLINTAPFSTLKPNDKELHYFPREKMHMLKKSADANLCVTVMHHSYEWFHWSCKSDLEKTIVDNSEVLLIGHDHQEHAGTVSIDNSLDTWVSAAGKMEFTSFDYRDSFNIVVIDTETNLFDGYIFTWDPKAKIYVHQLVVAQKTLQSRSVRLSPLPSYIKSLKEDDYNSFDDFTKYFVFPKLVSEYKNEFGRHEQVADLDSLINILEEKRKLLIVGTTNAGKTTLLKYLYCHLCGSKVPLFVGVDNRTRLKPNNFIKHLFEEQYGDDSSLFERFCQLDKSEKVVIIDGWDILHKSQAKSNLLKTIDQEFGYIIFSSSPYQSDVVESLKEQISEESSYAELRIRPFFTEKRSQLVRNICIQKDSYNDEDIGNVNRLIDSLVQNNSSLFSLNPAFIIRYTNYFIQTPYQDYTKGEAVFSKIFEYELNQSIIKLSPKSDVDEIFTAFEEIAGNMYRTRQDVLPIENIRQIIASYNSEYGVNVNVKSVVEIGVKAKIFKQTDDLSIYFYNKNHLSYFIAKFLIRCAQSDPSDLSGIEYALKNICFGINADIILFISYLLNSTQTIMSIVSHAGELLTPWPEINLTERNISLLYGTSNVQISAPTEKEKTYYDEAKEQNEERKYSEDTIEATGLFTYDDSDIDKYPYRLIRAIKYTEMLCKALPSFYSSLKVSQKQTLVNAIYAYPRKIAYALLRPIDLNLDAICDNMVFFAQKNRIVKKDGSMYTKSDFREMVVDYSRATLLGMFDHFSEICTGPKTIDLLKQKEISDISEEIERLLITENSGNTDALLKEAEFLLKKHDKIDIQIMVKLIVRKHILCTPELLFSKKQQLIDRIFGKSARKSLMLPHANE